MNPDDLLTITEAAEYSRVSRQAVYVALKDKRLLGFQRKNKWFVRRADLDYYRSQKYIGDNRKNAGKKIFNLEEGRYSVHQVAKFMAAGLGRPYTMNRVYFLLMKGRLKALRVGAAWVIMKEDAVALLQDEQARESKRMGYGA